LKTWDWRQSTVHGAKPRDLNHLVRVQTLTGHTHAVRVLRPTARGDLLASAGDDGMVCVWQLQERPAPAAAVAAVEDDASLVLPLYAPVPWRTYAGHTLPITDLAWNDVRGAQVRARAASPRR
jgi:hypothetical protein